MTENAIPRWYRLYSIATLVMTGVLVWWGAAVTTENVGLAVPDWPLSFGSINPKGWWLVPGVRLEHGHRLLAAGVGLLTLGLWAGAWLRTRDRGLRIATPAAVVLVILQGVAGGVRVLRVSDEFGILHGCLGQSFFCLLLLIVLMAHNWAGPRPVGPGGSLRVVRAAASALFGAVFLQLVLGAVLRHTQRFHLADHGLFLTGDGWFPGFGRSDLLVLFLHKWWAIAVAGLSVWVIAGPLRAVRSHRLVARVSSAFLAALAAQVTLGVAVILTRKSFWFTNFHVINGQLLLAGAFVLAVCAWRAVSRAEATAPERVRLQGCTGGGGA